ncbi:hypothetical protein, partial [Flavobacterium sp.]|uniref:hypothetical protein n=1 Tax=Flavobacterium sp. TaxID=239 RepID=UPI003B9B9BE8
RDFFKTNPISNGWVFLWERLKDFKITRFQDYKIERLQDSKITRLKDCGRQCVLSAIRRFRSFWAIRCGKRLVEVRGAAPSRLSLQQNARKSTNTSR